MSFVTEGAGMLLAHSGQGQSLTILLVKASFKIDLTSSTIASSVSYKYHKPSDTTTSHSYFNKRIRTSSRSVLVIVARFIPPNSTAAT